eukprot:snap_masked-scaffold_14-processed-gene-9.26-mRNA-1 protein AED:0.24 eAED:0.24 QI:0/0/0/0.5/1/1/2/0/106
MKHELRAYEVLGVTPDSNDVEIRRAYRNLVLKFHPDKENGSTEKFLQVQQAFKFLTGSEVKSCIEFEKRKEVDNTTYAYVKNIDTISFSELGSGSFLCRCRQYRIC